MGIIQVFFSRFLPVLLATLIGVYAAFESERKRDEKKSKARVLEHLQSLKKEVDGNLEVQREHIKVIERKQQSTETDGEHFTLGLYSTDVWDAVLEDRLLDVLPVDLFYDLHDLYSNKKSTNELIRRLRIDALHPEIGDKKGSNLGEYDVWTQTVYQFNRQKNRVEAIGLGPMIRNRGDSIGRDIQDVEEEMDEQIQRLRQELDDSWLFFGVV